MPQTANPWANFRNALGFNIRGEVGAQGDVFGSSVHGTKYNQAFTGALFSGANPSAVTNSVGLATTYLGLCLTNPAASGFNISIRKVGLACLAAPSGFLAGGVMTGAGTVTHTTPVTPRAAKVGGAVGVGKLDSAATIPTPVLQMLLGGNAATAGSVSFAQDLEGSLLLPPGTFAAIYLSAALSSGFVGSLEWEEIPVVS